MEQALGVSRRSAFRALELSVHFGPGIAERYGSEKPLAMHWYLKVTERDAKQADRAERLAKLSAYLPGRCPASRAHAR